MREMKKKVFNGIMGARKDVQDYYDDKIKLKHYEVKPIPKFKTIEEESNFPPTAQRNMETGSRLQKNSS